MIAQDWNFAAGAAMAPSGPPPPLRYANAIIMDRLMALGPADYRPCGCPRDCGVFGPDPVHCLLERRHDRRN